MKKNTKTPNGSQTSSEARLKAFRDKMKAKGMIGGGRDYLGITVDGAFLIGKWLGSKIEHNKKFKKDEVHHSIEVTEGFGRSRAGIEAVKPGIYDVRAGGQFDAFVEKHDYKAGDEIAAYYKGKSEPTAQFKQGCHQFEMFAEEKA